MIMKRITFVLLGMIAIVAYLLTTTQKIETKIVHSEKVSANKQHANYYLK